ncbi:non-ribosomal peptide synthetase [Rathayibacter tritici]|uniref:Non-ribosomal peptide synthetase n=1 Tax=Rathayibacter tritici TaxID=33888 RepID=A0A160KQT2_9MICO|nr:non-ribosomal peptide synthetase [Rathayibacter tritici]AND15926.1 non-ribosomal peptide synthetase [Rathayibacter tritici]PPI41073.1 non-ribosomal peptide synthetase [Rathayibacter tritici]
MTLDVTSLLSQLDGGTLDRASLIEQLRAARSARVGPRTIAMSTAQMELWAEQRIEAASTAYSVPLCFEVQVFDPTELQAAVDRLVTIHPVLGSVVDGTGARPCLTVGPSGRIEVVDVATDGSGRSIGAEVDREVARPFSMDGEPLVRVTVFPRSTGGAVVLVVAHHLVCDGRSAAVIARTLFRAPRSPLDDPTGDETPELLAPAIAERLELEVAGRIDESAAHWRTVFPAGVPASSSSSLAGAARTARGRAAFEVDLPPSVVGAVDVLARRGRTSRSMVLLTAYAVALLRVSGTDELIVGVPFNERRGSAESDAVGMLVTVVPVRVRATAAPFVDMLASVQSAVVAGMRHRMPLSDVAALLPRTSSGAPVRRLVENAFVYQDVLRGLDEPAPGVRLVRDVRQEGEYDFSLEVWPRGESLSLVWKHRGATTRQARQVHDALVQVIAGADLGPVDAGQRLVHEQVAARADETPSAVAVSSGGSGISYADLLQRSERLSNVLVSAGARPGVLVAVLVERSVENVVALLAVLRSGAAYVPLDPSLPAERVAAVLQDSGASIVVTEPSGEPVARTAAGDGVTVVSDWSSRLTEAGRAVRPAADDPAYVIYTSGSTGVPKGVIITQGGFANLLAAMGVRPGIGPEDCLLAVTTVGFDMAQLEVFLPLVNGARCHVASRSEVTDPGALARLIADLQPTIMQATPAVWSMLSRSGWRNEEGVRVVSGGEALPRSLQDFFATTGTECWNFYGPTEVTVYATGGLVPASGPITIGTPIDGVEVLIMDESLTEVAPGAVGELCVAGAGVAAGYVGRPELTAGRFVELPGASGGRLYRTGDLARLLPDREIEYLGRRDLQVKVRGNRVELDEVEWALTRLDGVTACVVVARPLADSVQLVAYVVAQGVPVDGRELRHALADGLPDYMVPEHVVQIDSIPLTANGKVDRASLAARPIRASGAVASVEPSGRPVADVVEACWRDVLGLETVDEGVTFFDAGGDSLTAVLLADEIARRTRADFSVTDLFRLPSVGAIADHLSGGLSGSVPGGDCPRSAPARDEEAASSLPELPENAVAVVGISAQFPGIADHWALWEALQEGRSTSRFWTSTELRAAGVPADVLEDPAFVPLRTDMEGADAFDGDFFRLSPAHVDLMDPAFRLVLAHAWRVVEDAGHDHRTMPATGVYVSVPSSAGASPAAATEHGVLRDPEEYLGWVMAQPGTVAAMVSYQLGFEGPSLAVHSNCSSSLSALDLAVGALQRGDVDFAVVAAASASPTATHGYVHQTGLNLSSDGRLRAFDGRADGMAPGEGAGALLLRRATDAVVDRDHVYGLVRASGTGSDGARPSGFYSPSEDGQNRLIRSVLDRAGVDAGTIGYVEAHGTGTLLGDPIELAALSRAYRSDTERICGVGSVKSTLGHLDTAAGVVGAIAVLMALHEHRLPVNGAFEAPNPRLALDESPFFVVDVPQDWPTHDGPRRAAQSAFGLGGSNAHVVYESYEERRVPEPSHKAVVVLSARTDDDLLGAAGALRHTLQDRGPFSLSDVAFTLAVGRVGFDVRVAFVVRDIAELVSELDAFCAGTASRRRTGSNDHSECARVDPSTVAEWLRRPRLRKLAKAWTAGQDVDWSVLHDAGARRVSLPTYHFASTPRGRLAASRPARTSQAAVAPRPGDSAEQRRENISGVEGLRVRWHVAADDSAVDGHVVNGRCILPAVATLSFVSSELRRSGEATADDRLRFEDVVWSRPVVIGPEGIDLDLVVERDAPGGRLRFAVAVQGAAESEGAVAGSVSVDPRAADAETVDLDGLRARFGGDTVTPEVLYARVRANGVDYGRRFRRVLEARLTPGNATGETLAALWVDADDEAFETSVLDAAVHAAAAGGARADRGDAGARMPFSVDEVVFAGGIVPGSVAWVRPVVADDETTVDLDVLDTQGRPTMSLRGLRLRARRALAHQQVPTSPPEVWLPRWRALHEPATHADPVRRGGRTLVIDPSNRLLAEDLRRLGADDCTSVGLEGAELAGASDVVWVVATPSGTSREELVGPARRAEVTRALHLVSALMTGLGADRLTVTIVTFGAALVHPGDQVLPDDAAVHGLVGCAAKEAPAWSVRVIDLEPGSDSRAVTDAVYAAHGIPEGHGGATLARRRGRWFATELVQTRFADPVPPVYRSGGVYVVLGGAGGIGRAWSERVISRAGAAVVWIGRRPATETEEDLLRLAGLAAAHGAPTPIYLQADATDTEELARARDAVLERFGRIDGVVNSTIVLADRALGGMDEATFSAAYAAKADVALASFEVFAPAKPELMLSFSSVQSLLREPGQANYAAGCAFEEALVDSLREHPHDRDASADAPSAPPVVRAVHWGWWGTLGVASGDGHRTSMMRRGAVSLDPTAALDALEQFLATSEPRVVLAHTSGTPLAAITSTDAFVPAVSGSDSILAAVHRSDLDRLAARAVVVEPEDDHEFVTAAARIVAAVLDAEDDGDPVLAPWRAATVAWLQSGVLGAERPRAADLDGLWRRWDEQRQDLRSFLERPGHVALVERVLRSLPDVLAGRSTAHAVLFPGGSMGALDAVYADDLVARHVNDRVAAAVVAAVRLRAGRTSRPGRILEVGAGTGATTAAVLDALDAAGLQPDEYVFSDVSPAFLQRAEERFGRHEYFRCETLDLLRPAESGAAGAPYDVVIATNVLHALPDVTRAVRAVGTVLTRNGLLLLNEMTRGTWSANLTVGLLPGWWGHLDPEVRLPGSPVVAPDRWREVLSAEGFRTLGPVEGAEPALGQDLVIAEASGGHRRVSGPPAAPEASTTGTIVAADVQGDSQVRTATDDLVRRTVAEVLRLDESAVASDRDLFELGLDSLLVVSLRAALQRAGFRVDAGMLLDQRTVRGIAAAIDDADDLRAARLPADGPAQEEPVGAGVEAAAVEAVTAAVTASVRLAPGSVGPDDDLVSLGLDSILIVQATSAIRRTYPTLSASALFEHRTARRVAEHLTATSRASVGRLEARADDDRPGEVPADASGQQCCELSTGQRGLWALHEAAPGGSAYTVPLAFMVDGLDVVVLEEAAGTVRRRHDLLSRVVTVRNGRLVFVAPEREQPWFHVSDLPAGVVPVTHLRASCRRPFDLAAGPLFRITVFRGAADTSWVLVEGHHIVFDAVSAVLVVGEVFAAYRQLTGQSTPSPLARPVPFDDFVAEEAANSSSPAGLGDRAWWRTQLMDAPRVPGLPPVRADAVEAMASASASAPASLSISSRLSPALSAAIATTASDWGVRPGALFLSLFARDIGSRVGADEIVIGVPSGGSRTRRFAGTVGHFVTMVPLRLPSTPAPALREQAREVQNVLLEALGHAVPLATIVADLGHDADARPLFRHAFMYQDWDASSAAGDDAFVHVDGVRQEGEYEVVLEVTPPRGASRTFGMTLKFDTRVLDAPSARLLIASLVGTLEHELGVAATSIDPEIGSVATDPGMTVSAAVSLRAAADPSALAVAAPDGSLDRGQLNRRSSTVASRLRDVGIGRGSTVAVLLDRTLDLVPALIGSLRAGAAYVPLDPALPAERLAAVLKRSGCDAIVVDGATRAIAQRAVPDHTVIVDLRDATATDPSPEAFPAVGLDDPAYVIYTSGSTGEPKGVVIPHRALQNFVGSMADRPGIGPSDRVLALTTPSFDISVLELLVPVAVGASTHLVAAQATTDPVLLAAELERVQPTVVQATPSTWAMLLTSGWANPERARLLVGGEALPPSLAASLTAISTEVWNLFGPTETTVWSSAERLDPGRPVRIGRPIANTQLHVAHADGRRARDGEIAELWIGGAGLALGYRDQPSLTADRFVRMPFAAGETVHRTGDLARRHEDGSIEYLGRVDSQVKVRGHRVELAEIEHVLETVPTIASAVVVARQQSGSQQIVAYVVAVDGHDVEPRDVARWTSTRLPDYMVPDFTIVVAGFPTTANGKVDRRALAARPIALRAPASSTEPAEAVATEAPAATVDPATVLHLWREVLGVADLDEHDRFAESGGTSVLAAVLAQQLRTVLGVPFTAADVYATVDASGAAELAARRVTGTAVGSSSAQRSSATAREHSVGAAADPAPALPAVPDPDEGPPGTGCVAVIGVACRVPGAADAPAFWQNLLDGVESVQRLSEAELIERGVDPDELREASFVPARAGLADPTSFDAPFFAVSDRDARLMDPQARLLLEQAWLAVEDSARLPADIVDAAVYVSTSTTSHHVGREHRRRDSDALVAFLQAQPGTTPTMLSHRMGLRGPSLHVQSNCSSSLAGLALAVQGIRSGATTHAIVGGSGMFGPDAVGHHYEQGMTLSSDGSCRAFSADATGMLGGEGVVAVVLKDAVAAIRDGDDVYALIRSVEMNNDGDRKAGYHAPSAAGQAEVIAAALRSARVDARSVSYVEAHGTGTTLGDPIEVMSLSEAYRGWTDDRGFCGIGSVKSNIGHLDAAAGLIGLVKTAFVLHHRVVPPTINVSTPNPLIDFATSPFRLLTAVTPLIPDGGPLRAGVDSFGIGGTNVHAVLEEAPPRAVRPATAERREIVPISVREGGSLAQYATSLADRLAGRAVDSEMRLADVAFTFQNARSPFRVRAAVVASSLDELVEVLRGLAADVRAASTGGLVSVGARSGADDGVEQLARAWADGADVDWAAAGSAVGGRRIHLPGYPFARRRYDEPGHDELGSDGSGFNRAGPENRRSDDDLGLQGVRDAPPHVRVFDEDWEPVAASGALMGRDRSLDVVVVVGDDSRIADAVRSSGRAARVVAVSQPDTPSWVGAFSSIRLRRERVSAVIHCGLVHDAASDPAAALASIAAVERALARSGVVTPSLVVAASAGDEVSAAVADAAVAFARSSRTVLPGTRVQIVASEDQLDADGWARMLLDELGSEHEAVLWRSETRMALCRRERQGGTDQHAAEPTRPAFVQGGVYLITGGLGGLGRGLAEHLARRHGATLLLLGRRAGRDGGPFIDRLRALGGDGRTITVDITNREALVAALGVVAAEFPRLDGVFHLAGSGDPMPAAEQTIETARGVLAPKVAGTLALEAALTRCFDGPPALLSAFSSSSAVVGDLTGGTYAAANRFQAALARTRRRAGSWLRWRAIQWPLWQDGALGAGTRAVAADEAPLSLRTGLDLLEQLVVQEGVAPLVLAGHSAQTARFLALVDDVPVARSEPAVDDPAAVVRSVVADVLGTSIDDLDDHSPFVDLGLDSIRLTQASNRLSAALRRAVTTTELFDHPTLARLIEHVAEGPVGDHEVPASAAAECSRARTGTLESELPHRAAVLGTAADVSSGIAVIGASGVFPGRGSVDAFWDALVDGEDLVTTLPASRFPASDSRSGERPRVLGAVDDVDAFDAAFFEIAPKEARRTDPRQRLLLQESWRALEDAGIGLDDLAELTVGVFVGAEHGDYALLDGSAGGVTSNSDSVLAARLSYFLDLDGPVLTVNTACSSGLTALHLAGASLRAGECDVAVVAAVNLVTAPDTFDALDAAGMTSVSGVSRPFDTDADGMVPGEAALAVVVRPVDAAIAAGDTIHSVVVASGIGHDGRTNGITAPSGAAQARLMTDVRHRAGLRGADLGHVVAHGTGTPLGDPVELSALAELVGVPRPDGTSCAVTSIKANAGHMFAAAGLAGLVVLSESVRRGIIPKAVHVDEPTRAFDWDAAALRLPRTTEAWTVPDGGLRVGAVSAFGISGSNAHAVVREHPVPDTRTPTMDGGAELYVLSAKTPAALDRAVAAFVAAAETDELRGVASSDVAQTLGRGRHHHRHRTSVVATSITEAARAWADRGIGAHDATIWEGTLERSRTVDPGATKDLNDIQALLDDPRVSLDERRSALERAAAAWVAGREGLTAGPRLPSAERRRVRLPTYRFEATRYWVGMQPRADGDPVAQPTPVSGVMPESASSPIRLRPVGGAEVPQRPASVDLDGGPVHLRSVGRPRATVEHDVLTDLKAASGFGDDGLVVTLNRTGVMVEDLIPYSEEFAEYAGSVRGEVLDLGCAYGVATVAALEAGARVVALDMEQRHLDILWERVTDEAADRLSLVRGMLPDVDFAPGRFSAVHASRVLHFLSPDDLRTALQKMVTWLEPGGRLFLSTDSPYFGYWASAAHEYEHRRAAGHPWPGYVPDVHTAFDAALVEGGPSVINPWDPEVAVRECRSVGLEIEQAGWFGAVGPGPRAEGAPGPGMEHVGVIARKPLSDPGPRAVASADGEVIPFDVVGSAPTTVVLVHGLGCRSTFWGETIAALRDEHTVVTLDLAGHGPAAGSASRKRWSVDAFADDVIAVLDRIGAERVVLVGHSLGGPVSQRVAERDHARVVAVIGVEAFHDMDGSALSQRQVERLAGSLAREPARAVELVKAPAAPALVEQIDHERARVGEGVIVPAFRELLATAGPFPVVLGTPVSIINSSAFAPTDSHAARRRGVVVDLMDDVGHFPMLESPTRFAEILRRHVRRSVGALSSESEEC